MVEKEMDKLEREKKALQSQVDKLTGVVQTQREHLAKPQAAEVNVEQILAGMNAKMDEMKEEMREEIQRQTALAGASKAGGAPVVDMQSFLDRLFESDDLETNIKVVKQAKSKLGSASVEKLKGMRDQ
jgi:fumarate hydratase class II